MKTSLNFFLIVYCLTVATVQAEAPRPFLNLGFDLGGEKLAKVIYEDGDTASIRVNEGGNISIGLALPLGSGVDLQSSIGYQGINDPATNGEVSWRSFPWETSIIAHLDRFQIGGGVIYHLSPRFKSEGDLSIGDIEFDDSLGYQAQIAYLVSTSIAHGLTLGVKYTGIDFENNQRRTNGDSTAFFAKLYF